MRAMVVVLALVGFASCPKAVPQGRPTSDQPPDAGSAVDAALLAEVNRVDLEVEQALQALDTALWQQWTGGAPADLTKLRPTQPGLVSKQTLQTLRRARAEHVEPDRARRLEAWVTGQLLTQALAADTEAVASLEAGATFSLDGKEVAWHDLPRLLVTERSAVKRRALWAASSAVAAKLDALLAHREVVAQQTLAALDAPTPLDFEADARDLNLESLAAEARALLAATDEPWKQTLAALSSAELKLPVEALTRADLPRLLKVPPSLDAAFPKAQVARATLDTFTGLGLASTHGLSFDFADGAKKQPLPLTVAPGRDDVRVVFKPTGGLRDEVQALGELGTALALRQAPSGHAALDRLGDPALAQSVAMVFMGLASEPGWLEARGVSASLEAGIVLQARAHRLSTLRRACLLVLLRLETEGLSDAEARAKAVELAARALGVKVPAEDGLRLRLELDDSLRAASTIKAMMRAAQERQRLGANWWTNAEAVKGLLARYDEDVKTGRWSADVEAGRAALLRSLGGEVRALEADGGVVGAGAGAPDAGLEAPPVAGEPADGG